MKNAYPQEQNEPKSAPAIREEAILNFWDSEQIFEKTLAKEAPKGKFVFFDGPPYATGTPHFGHLLPSTLKDAIPRYKTMQGYHVARKWGWDCHGLPIENLIEKELGLADKKAIVDYGIDKFNKAARESVFKYDAEWKKVVHRMGRFVDMDNAYHTMDASYTESVWWSFKTLYEKGLVYEGYKVMQVCPRCETTLSNFEVGQGYKDVQDLSVYALFKLKNENAPSASEAASLIADEKIPTYMLAWTTTPWTLHGNMALAVNPDLNYVKIKTSLKGSGAHTESSEDKEGAVVSKTVELILAESRLEVIKNEYEIVATYKGSELAGTSYIPVFDTYYKTPEEGGAGFPIADHESRRENAWKIYTADFVTADDGTGIVHIAPGYGDDDYKLGEKNKLPIVQHVPINGHARPELGEPFSGKAVKIKGDTMSYDIEVIKALAHAGLLFAKEKITHSYPLCWRCDTPLINLATSAWFVEVTKLQNRLIEENKTVKWIPESVGTSRFGAWLENLRDWNISRARFWGAPLPVWRGEQSGKIQVIGSIEELKSYIPKRNTYTVMRHGESVSNTLGVISSNEAHLEKYPLTEKGIEEVKVAAEKLKATNKITKIYSSDFIRTRQTAELMADTLGISHDQIIYDKRLRECKVGESDGTSWLDHWSLFKNYYEKMFNTVTGGESVFDVKHRVTEFLYEVDASLKDENILIVTHGLPLRMITQTALGRTSRDLVRTGWSDESDANASLHPVDWRALPHNDTLEIDIHRPYVDQISWTHPETGERMIRVADVFDVWYDSGSMPFAQVHYPFENKELFEEKNGGLFPANFISEGLDQTRGWFYSLLALGVGLFDRVPYENVVVNGLILAEDGRKMSKSLKNYPDLWPTIQKFGADSLRFFLASSPAVHGEEVAFSEKGLDEVNKKVFNRLENIYSFLVMYAGSDGENTLKKVHFTSEEIQQKLDEISHPLDLWVLAKLNQLIKTVTENFEAYMLDKATRPIAEFIDEVSTWYLRRSRDRFKGDDEADKAHAMFVTRFVLERLSLLMTPVTPFIAEDMYQKVKMDGIQSSNLAEWPEPFMFKHDKHAIIDDMQRVRDLVEHGLALRSAAKIKVRQPLARFTYEGEKLAEAYEEIIKDELNVKVVIKGDTNQLDTEITAELKEEGAVRELIRAVQARRKDMNLNPQDMIELVIDINTDATLKQIIERFAPMIQKTVSARTIIFNGFDDVTVGTPVESDFGIMSFLVTV